MGIGGGIKVCFSRNQKPEERGICYEEAKDKEIIFEVTNPCQYRNLFTCEPLYFAITALDEGTTNNNLCLGMFKIFKANVCIIKTHNSSTVFLF